MLDVWFERDIKPRLKGRAVLIRYADDAVLGFSHEEDARRVLAVLPKRFSKYGLTLHPEKTRLVDFRKPRRTESSDSSGSPRRQSFDLLGFTHYWARSRRGFWVIKRKTAKDRLSRRSLASDNGAAIFVIGHLVSSTDSCPSSCAGTTSTTGSPGTRGCSLAS